MNRSIVLNVIREDGPLSKADVARSTGLSQATVGTIVRNLVDVGFVTERASVVPAIGRPPVLLELNLASYHVVGMKLMEDQIVGAVTDLEARTLGQATFSLKGTTPEEVADGAAGVVSALLKDKEIGRARLLGVGMGMGGVIDTVQGTCVHSPFFGWRDVPIAKLVEDRIALPVRIDNDVNTLALAERWFGFGAKFDDFLLVTLGRGVGLSIVTAGNIYRGANGGAGEFGHTVAGDSDALCSCGNRGCVEALVGGPALLARASELAERLHLEAPRSLQSLYELASHEEFSKLLVQAGTALGRAMGNLVNLFAPSLIVLSGEGVPSADALITAARAELDRHVVEGLRDSFDLVVEPLSDEAWARGAASLILDAVFDPPTRSRPEPMWKWEGID